MDVYIIISVQCISKQLGLCKILTFRKELHRIVEKLGNFIQTGCVHITVQNWRKHIYRY